MSTQKSARSLGIQWGVSLLLTLACYVIPEQGIYTHQVKLFLTITVFSLALAAFELVPNLVVAVVMSGFWIVDVPCGPLDHMFADRQQKLAHQGWHSLMGRSFCLS